MRNLKKMPRAVSLALVLRTLFCFLSGGGFNFTCVHLTEPKTKKVKETSWDWQLLNDVKAIWLRSPKEISDDDYANFFHSIAKVCYSACVFD